MPIDSVTGKQIDLSRMDASYLGWLARQQKLQAEREAEAERAAQARKDAVEAWFREHVDPFVYSTDGRREERRLQRWAERVFGEPGGEHGR